MAYKELSYLKNLRIKLIFYRKVFILIYKFIKIDGIILMAKNSKNYKFLSL
jgi:hypothetical protein